MEPGEVQRNTQVQLAKFAFDDFIFVVSSAVNSVGTTLEFGSGPEAKPNRASAVCFFFLSTTMVFAEARTHFPPRKHPCLS